MTVKELIEKLMAEDQNAEVTIWLTGNAADECNDATAFEPVVFRDSHSEDGRVDLMATSYKIIMK